MKCFLALLAAAVVYAVPGCDKPEDILNVLQKDVAAYAASPTDAAAAEIDAKFSRLDARIARLRSGGRIDEATSLANRRDALQAHLTEKGIGTLIHYPIPPHLQEAYAPLGHKKGDFPIAERIAETCLSLPLWPGMTEQDVWQAGQEISKFFHG